MTIRYHDVSHYNGNYVPVGPTCAKATEGSTYIDPEYGAIRKRTLAGGWPFLPYHFLRHGNIDAQVDHAYGVVGKQSLMLDVETAVDGSVATLADTLAFADRWHTVTGQRVTLAYIPRWYWSGKWGSPSLTGLTSRGIGLVSSNYTTYSDNGPGWTPYGGVTPVIWQYTSTPYDLNAFKGTEAELVNLWENGTAGNSNPSVPVVPPEVDMPMTDADADTLFTADVIPNFPWAPNRDSNAKIPATTAIITGGNQAHAAYNAAADASAKVDALGAKVDALTAAVAALPTTSAPAAPLSDADVARIAAKVDALIAARYAS